MAINTFPAVASPVKSVQRGSAAGAGTVTITSVDISKSFVNVFGTASSGTVAASGAIGAASGNVAAANGNTNSIYGGGYGNWRNGSPSPGGTKAGVALNASAININATNITGGTNNLVAAVVQGYLSNATSLVVSGACRWEVVEFN
jgi:hypothetical protein